MGWMRFKIRECLTLVCGSRHNQALGAFLVLSAKPLRRPESHNPPNQAGVQHIFFAVFFPNDDAEPKLFSGEGIPGPAKN